jgi:uncharacterized membrane protein YhaH (DUF805 family)
MGMVESVTTCMSKYIDFSGRASRSEYWWFFLFIVIGLVLVNIVEMLVLGSESSLLISSFFLATIVPWLAADWRRLHDSGRPGWYNLISIFVVPIILISLFATGMLYALEDETPNYPALFVTLFVGGGIYSLKLWWLTRPSDIGANHYGAPGD